jgi:hypothetical protein
MFVILVFIHKDTVLMLSLFLSTGVQLRADSADRIYDYSLYYNMLMQVLELTSHNSQNVRLFVNICGSVNHMFVVCTNLSVICTRVWSAKVRTDDNPDVSSLSH